MALDRMLDLLDEHRVKYLTIRHSPAYTAQEIAALTHTPGKELAKTVIVKLDGVMAMAVLPASEHVDMASLREITGAHKVELAHEEEFANLFPECELGAMPPFGNLWGLEVYVAPHLTEDDHISFNAGNHMELLRMRYEDFARIVKPKVLGFASA